MTNSSTPGDDDFDDGEEQLDESCPNCGIEYDDVDYEYQICHWCGFQNSNHSWPAYPIEFKS